MSDAIALKALSLARVALVGVVLVALYCVGGADLAGVVMDRALAIIGH